MQGDVSGQLVQAGTVSGSVRQTTNVWLAPEPVPMLASVAVPALRPGHRTRGRAALVSATVEAIRAGAHRVVVLHGAGGYGKTTVAIDVAAVAGRDVWWVDAGTEASLTAGLHAVAVTAGADRERVREAWTRGAGAAPELLWDTLNARDADWLLVLDNADDPDLLAAGQGRVHQRRGWLRTPDERGSVLVTTRTAGPRTWGDAALHPVGPLTQDDGGAVLCDLAPDAGTAADAATLAARLGGLPLALWLAGSYLAAARTFPDLPGLHAPTTFARYLRAWEERFVELSDLSWDTEPTHERELLCRTWELSLDLLDRRGHPLARPLLRTLACLGRSPVPTALLDAAALAASSTFSGLTAAALNGAVLALGEVGLAEPDRAGPVPTIGLHPVVRDVNRHQAQADEAYRHNALSMLTHLRERSDPADTGAWPLWHVLVDHTELAVELASDPAEPDEVRIASADVCHEAAFFCDRTGLDQRSLDLNRIALKCRTEVLGPRAENTLATKRNRAFVLRKLNRLEEAGTAYREVLAQEMATRGERHQQTLLTRCALAEVLRVGGELKTAEAEFRAVARIIDESPQSGNRQAHLGLAVTLRERGRLAEAEAVFVDELARSREELGDHHVMALLAAFVDLLHDQGREAEAAPLAADVAKLATALLGPEHEHTLALRTRYGAAMADTGDMAGAEAEFRDILAAAEKTKGKDHPLALGARRVLAVTLVEGGHVAAAEAEFRNLIEAETRVYGPDGVRWRTRFSLASLEARRGDHEEAERVFREILTARERSGAAGLAEVQVRLRLATCLELRGDLDGAETEYRTAIDAARTSLGPDHHQTAQATGHLGSLLLTRGDHAGGARLLKEAHAVFVARYGPNHLHALTTRANLAAVPHSAGAVAEALAEYRDIVRTAERAGNVDHPDMLGVRHNFASAAMDMGETAEAERVLRAAVPVAEARLGDNHPDTARLRLRLGEVLYRTGHRADAERLFTAVMSAHEQMRLTESDTARTVRYYLALLAYRRENLAMAETWSRDLLAVNRRVAGPQEEQTLKTQLLLASTLYCRGTRREAKALAQDLLEKASSHEDIITAAKNLMRAGRGSGLPRPGPG